MTIQRSIDPSPSSFQRMLDTYARARIHTRTLEGQGQPVPVELQQFMRNVEELARVNFSPEELRHMEEHEIRPREQRIFQERYNRNREERYGEYLRRKDERARENTQGMLGQNKGLDSETLEKVTQQGSDGRFKGTLKLPTRKAKINWDHYENQARTVGPLFGIKDPTAKKFHAKLDAILEARNGDPEKYDNYVKSLGIPRKELNQYMDAWDIESHSLEVVGRQVERDKDLPNEEEVKITDRDNIRALLLKEIHQEEDETGEEFYSEDISPRVRQDAAEETARLQHEVASQGGNPEGHMGTRDAIIRAMDQQGGE